MLPAGSWWQKLAADFPSFKGAKHSLYPYSHLEADTGSWYIPINTVEYKLGCLSPQSITPVKIFSSKARSQSNVIYCCAFKARQKIFIEDAQVWMFFNVFHPFWRHDTQHNDIAHNDTQHNDIEHNDTQHNKLVTVLSAVVILHSVAYLYCCADCLSITNIHLLNTISIKLICCEKSLML